MTNHAVDTSVRQMAGASLSAFVLSHWHKSPEQCPFSLPTSGSKNPFLNMGSAGERSHLSRFCDLDPTGWACGGNGDIDNNAAAGTARGSPKSKVDCSLSLSLFALN